jgi:predicted lipase
LFLACSVAVVWVSALQAQVPRNMPFGVTGTSPVVTAAESTKISGYQISFVNTTYSNEAAAMDAINQGKIYGAYITGTSSDTLLTVQAKSFFAW